MRVAVAGGMYEDPKPLRGLEFIATRSSCTCCRVEGAPSALIWRRAAAGVANSCRLLACAPTSHDKNCHNKQQCTSCTTSKPITNYVNLMTCEVLKVID